MIRFGLCCIFTEGNIKFKRTTAKTLSSFTTSERIAKISDLCLHNTKALLNAIKYINTLDIKSFRISSPVLPLYTHPQFGYDINKLSTKKEILYTCKLIREFKNEHNIRLSFHPDQFVVINSPGKNVVSNSFKELDYQAMYSELVGAEVINIHAGGAYGDKPEALNRFQQNFRKLPVRVKERLTIENDDKTYTPYDIIELSNSIQRPFVYDIHHHRCNPDNLTISEATDLSIKSWSGIGEPYFHISSPKNGWNSTKLRPHADYIDINDFPNEWINLKADFTVDIEAKMKEKAIIKLREMLGQLKVKV